MRRFHQLTWIPGASLMVLFILMSISSQRIAAQMPPRAPATLPPVSVARASYKPIYPSAPIRPREQVTSPSVMVNVTPELKKTITVRELGILPGEDPFTFSSSTATRNAALKMLPIAHLSAVSQEKIRFVLSDVALYRRCPVYISVADQDIFRFLLQHPDVVINIWEIMEISQIKLTPLDPTRYHLQDNAGTKGTLEILYHDPQKILIYVNGTYEGVPFPGKVQGNGLIMLQHQPITDAEGHKLLAIRVDSFVRLQGGGASLLTRTFQPMVGRIADHNLDQTLGFVDVLCRTASLNGPGVVRLGQRLKNVPPTVREQFGTHAMRLNNILEIELYGSQQPLPMNAKN